MKYRFLPTLLSALLLSISNLNAAHTVHINGSSIDNKLKRISFDGDNATLLFTDGTTATYDMSTIAVLFASTGNSTDNIEISLLSTLVGNELHIEGTEQGQRLAIYDAAGRQLLQMSTLSGSMHIDLSTLPAGVYVLSIGNTATRFIKR